MKAKKTKKKKKTTRRRPRPARDKVMRIIKLIGELINTAVLIKHLLKKPPKEYRARLTRARKKLVDYSNKINHLLVMFMA